MKKITVSIVSFVFMLLVVNVYSQDLPTFYDGLTIKRISTWPNSPNLTSGFTVYLTTPMDNTGCNNSNIFSVLEGDFQRESYSLLLAAFIAQKKVRVRVAMCSDRPLVDRVEIEN